ncbi:hypothetical protein N7462_004553 [Penicillium macrosclerotiorum]|uniref:uncharacterized protein n=1 Tax=Penicillium macrosclerotiorum TaxID=303699 RepID=UPI0025486B6C|nr:uncharacterized protein N7462_004553 [Penicillium macrosclerotiorum]KAJ5690161.1 hypothetical protein N7462_004553 [Penicillium macrosclerotiorum]
MEVARGFSSGWEKRTEATMEAPLISEQGQTALLWIGVALSFILVIIRTHAQYKSSKQLFINDYWIFFAVICHLATAIVYQFAMPPMYELTYIGAGLKLPTAGFMDRASLFLKLQYAADILLWTTLWSVKFSLLFFFWRLFDSVNSHMRLFWWIMCGVTAATWITSVVLQEFACDPIQDFFTLVGTDIAGDICVMVIPFPLLHKLKVNRRKRWILIGIFSLPIIPIMFAILRLVMTNPKTHNVDPIKFQLFSMLENTSAIITSCLPAFRLFIVNAHNSTVHSDSRPSDRYSRGLGGSYRNFGGQSQNSRKNAGIPLGSLTQSQFDSYHGLKVVHERSVVGKAVSSDSDEEALNPQYPTPAYGVLVTNEYHVT